MRRVAIWLELRSVGQKGGIVERFNHSSLCVGLYILSKKVRIPLGCVFKKSRRWAKLNLLTPMMSWKNTFIAFALSNPHRNSKCFFHGVSKLISQHEAVWSTHTPSASLALVFFLYFFSRGLKRRVTWEGDEERLKIVSFAASSDNNFCEK